MQYSNKLNLKNGLKRLLALFFSFLLVACTQRFNIPYIEKISIIGDYQLFPTALSGDGTVLIGNSETIGAWRWSKATGVTSLRGALPGYDTTADAVNFDGSVVAGQVLQIDGSRRLYLWKNTTGVRLLPALPATYKISTPIQMSDDGQTLSFFCYDTTATPNACGDLVSSPNTMPMAQMIWSETDGYQSLRSKVHRRFDFIKVSGDLKAYFLETFKPRSFGRLDSSGNYISFQRTPIGFDPSIDSVMMNKNGTIIADTAYNNVKHLAVWNASGKILPSLKLLPNCMAFTITAIDNSGAIFGNAWCPYSSSGKIGVRVNNSSVQTIADWLRSKGLSNNFDLDTEVIFVSDDGKTIFGDTDFFSVPADESVNTITKTPLKNKGRSVSQASTGYFFVAHVQ